VAGVGARPVWRVEDLVEDLAVGGYCAEPVTDGDRLAPLGPDNTAYVLFTSGSTGVPKGVAVTHAGVSAVAVAQQGMYGLGADARVLMVAAPTFDASVGEVLLAVVAGAGLVVAPAQVYAGEALAVLIHTQQVSAALISPTVLSSLDPARLGGVSTLVVGGEACPQELVSAWAPGRGMFNAYGPTEATIWASCGPLSVGRRVTIGAPLPGVCALVLDARLNPVPVGVVGELYLAGPQLAHGYLGRVGLTAERFVANPYGPPGQRMYRSGDLVRWTATGTLDYLGRADTQIKLRGQRIELGEIDNTLLACPRVGQAATVVHHSDTGTSHLVAYITVDDGAIGGDIGGSSAGGGAQGRRAIGDDGAIGDDDAGLVAQWQSMYDQVFSVEVDSGFGMDFRGWNSSYTGERIPVQEMLQWRSATVDRILALGPGRVLEIGAGSGLLLSQIAPHCERYVGTDVSAAVIDTLDRSLRQGQHPWRDRVELLTRPAHHTEGLPRGYFDTVIVNSVIQYFPSAQYLAEVIDEVLGACRDRRGFAAGPPGAAQ
jgi:amino acid adenylation domain-containing protein